MRDYYRTLGVSRDATEEEIRARWIELTKKYHPDRRGGKRNEERMKEINEAYEVLGDIVKRMEYDFQRVVYRSPGKRFLWVLVFWILSMVGLGVVYCLISFNTSTEKSAVELELDERRFVSFPLVFSLSAVKPKTAVEVRAAEGGVRISEAEDVSLGVEVHPEDSLQSVSFHEVGLWDPGVISWTSGVSLEPFEEVHFCKSLSLAGLSSGSGEVRWGDPLGGVSDEVRKFLSEYIANYTEKNIVGFLSLFSRRAVQNQREGYDEIRRLYSKYFDYSKELHCQIWNPEIEVFGDCVRVVARYRVIQGLGGERRKVWEGKIRWVLEEEGGVLRIVSLDYKHEQGEVGID